MSPQLGLFDESDQGLQEFLEKECISQSTLKFQEMTRAIDALEGLLATKVSFPSRAFTILEHSGCFELSTCAPYLLIAALHIPLYLTRIMSSLFFNGFADHT